MAQLLEIKNLTIYYKLEKGWVHAVENVDIDINMGETFGLVGESGSGKTTIGYGITQLLPDNAYIQEGSVIYYDDTFKNGIDLIEISKKDDGSIDIFNEEIRKIRWKKISMIFQGAMNAFNPVKRVGEQISEAIKIHEPNISDEEARKKVEELYDFVGIGRDRIDNYPHEYSGGMKQRAMIAMALVLNPNLVIADEPTTALDVITQDKILGELKRLQKATGVAMMLITHDISVVAELADKVAVMYAGQLVEKGTATQIFKETAHPYTEGLLGSFPSIKGEKRRLITIPGAPPDLIAPPSGCRFHPRCPYAKEICKEQEPPVVDMGNNHYSKCHFARELYGGR